jgi:hypothetical protein
MNTKIIDNLRRLLDATAAPPSTITFFAGHQRRASALGLGNADSSRRMGTTPAYITRLFQTSATCPCTP